MKLHYNFPWYSAPSIVEIIYTLSNPHPPPQNKKKNKKKKQETKQNKTKITHPPSSPPHKKIKLKWQDTHKTQLRGPLYM